MKKSLVVLALALALGTGSAAQAQDYVMCPGDVLQVVVYGHEDLSTLEGNTQNSPYVVRPDGKVSFPLIGDVPVTYADTTPLERDFGFKPSTPLREGLRKFAEWYKKFYNC